MNDGFLKRKWRVGALTAAGPWLVIGEREGFSELIYPGTYDHKERAEAVAHEANKRRET